MKCFAKIVLLLTHSSNKLNQSNNIGCKMLTDINIGFIEDGDSVKDDSIDAAPLLEKHGGKNKKKRMPDFLLFQLR